MKKCRDAKTKTINILKYTLQISKPFHRNEKSHDSHSFNIGQTRPFLSLWIVALKETSTLKANGRLMVGNTVLFQISVESPAIRYQC